MDGCWSRASTEHDGQKKGTSRRSIPVERFPEIPNDEVLSISQK